MLPDLIQAACQEVLRKHWTAEEEIPDPLINRTRKEFDGDYTLVVFPYVKSFKKKPEDIAAQLGDALVSDFDFIREYNVVKGFLNLSVAPALWQEYIRNWTLEEALSSSGEDKMVMVEYCSPNTNKPIHLGHVRNILLGWAISNILEAAGYRVHRTQIINDRGIAICKSMLAWQLYGQDATPESTGMKGDFFVGHYYVLFEKKFQEEYRLWQQTPQAAKVYSDNPKPGENEASFFQRYKHDYFNKYSDLGRQAKDMLLAWEAKEEQTYALWQRMNQWVYDGFEVTYNVLGIRFDSIYYESDTYLEGKKLVQEGLSQQIFVRHEDGSVWVDLSEKGLDEKILLRADGTALYITQDMGTAELRYKDFGMDSAVYVVGDEQEYHFKVLFEVMKKLERPFAHGLYHLSYGMVELPTGKMKSREGTVVDADDLVAEVIEEAARNADLRGELEGLSKDEIEEIHRKIGLGALKFFILKVHPKKWMTYDPQESLDMQGQTGPYIQNAYVRIASVLRKNEEGGGESTVYDHPTEVEKGLIKEIMHYSSVIQEAAQDLDPSHVANYAYNLAKEYHRFYHDHRILTAESVSARQFRLSLSEKVKDVLSHAMGLLGIEMPEKM